MAHVLAHMTMSLDGYIADDHDEVGTLFEWYEAGPLRVPTAHPAIEFHLDEAGAAMMRPLLTSIGALVCGRRLFDLAGGWDGHHPVGAPVIVVTHSPPSDPDRWPATHFRSDVGQAVALAEEIAGERLVAIASAEIAGQALDLRLVDEVAVSLVPVILGRGKSYFGTVRQGPIRLEDPAVAVGLRATHLRYQVRR